MKRVLKRSRYGQRWQIETTNSMLKRLLGSALRARKYWNQCREILLRAITLNIMIVRRRQVFDRARMSPFLPPDDITDPFAITLTGYIDAIEDGNAYAERRRPPMSLYHCSQYQTVALGIGLAGAPSDSDDDIDREYLEVTHTTIDDHSVVLEFLSMRLHQRVVK